MEKIRVLPCFFVKYTNISFKCISCMIVPRSGNGLWVSNCNGWQTSHICRRGTVENVEKFISQFSFQNLSAPVPVSNRIFCFSFCFCFVLHFSVHQNKSIGFLTISPFPPRKRHWKDFQFKLCEALNRFSCNVLVHVK